VTSSDQGQSANSKKLKREITREISQYAVQTQFAKLPASVQTESVRTLVNWLGCALGGCREPAVQIAASVAAETGASPRATVLGHDLRTDIASAAFINCISSSILAFDDAHLPTVTHPSGPASAGLLALSEQLSVPGEEFLNALTLAVEVTCRLSNVLLLEPSKFNLGFYVTGLTAPIGVAVGAARLLKLDERRTSWAIGLAASQGSGFRATHGTMTAHFRPGQATRAGIVSTLLAAKGFDSSQSSLEDDKGFFDVFSTGANGDYAVDGLGEHFEALQNAYKPYPCGIVIHPTIDACLELVPRIGSADRIESVQIRVHPLTLSLTGIREPKDTLESHISVFHWAAAALLRGRAGLAETQQTCIDDPQIRALRMRVHAIPDPSLEKDESIVEVSCLDGVQLRSHVTNPRGSISRPMNDVELDAKFREQANFVLSHDRTERLLSLCRGAASLRDVGKELLAIAS
jgi:2-methylcitrate dehydratase PrpD